MNKHRATLILLTILLLTGAARESALAQDYKIIRDLRSWTGVGLELSPWKNWEFMLGTELRMKTDMGELNNYFGEAAARYRIDRNFSLEAGGRVTQDLKRNGSFETLSRYHLDLRFRAKISPLLLQYRLRYQKEIEGFDHFNHSQYYVKHVRNRVRLRLNSHDVYRPYVSAELFQRFDPVNLPDLEYIRLMLGCRFQGDSWGRIDAAWGVNLELTDSAPARIYVLKLNYSYAL